MKHHLLRCRQRALQIVEPDSYIAPLLHRPVPVPAIEEVLPDGSCKWAITPHLGRFLAGVVVTHGLRRVLEFGAGTSSLILARALKAIGGGRLTSIEQMPEWCSERWMKVKQNSGVDAEMVVSQPRLSLTRMGPVFLFRSAAERIRRRGPFDLVLIDAPQWFFGRDGAVPLVYAHLSPGACIVLDDAGRGLEQWTLFRWLRTYPALRLMWYDPTFGGRGLAVLRHTGEQAQSIDPLSFLTSWHHAFRLWKARRRVSRASWAQSGCQPT